jgi:CheY-like chemotaxis protein
MPPALPAPRTLRLLVVDDDAAIQTMMTAVFRRKDVTVEFASDGHAALDRLRRADYDAVVLDLMLPGTNGFEVLREVKHRRPELLGRTIVLTAASDLTLRDFTDGQLVRRVMRKPFDLHEFIEEVLACGHDGGTAPAKAIA